MNNGKFGHVENQEYVIRLAMALIKPYEGWRSFVYKCPAGKDTIGWGHNITDNGIPDYAERELLRDGEISEAIGDKLLHSDTEQALSDVVSVFGAMLFNSFSMNRKLAFINMMFQLGLPAFLTFRKVIQFTKLGKWDIAAEEMENSKWGLRDTPKRASDMADMVRSG